MLVLFCFVVQECDSEPDTQLPAAASAARPEPSSSSAAVPAALARHLSRASSDEAFFLKPEPLFELQATGTDQSKAKAAFDRDYVFYRDTRLWKIIEDMHGRVPKSTMRSWLLRTRTAVNTLATDGEILAGDGCTGSGLQHHMLRASLAYVMHQYDMKLAEVVYQVAAENDKEKARFITHQHRPRCLLKDVNELAAMRWHNVISGGRPTLPRRCSIGGGGFSCKALSKANNQRAQNKGCIRSEETTSGTTFAGLFFRASSRSARSSRSWKTCQR